MGKETKNFFENENLNDLLTIEQLTQLLNVHRSTIHNWVKQNLIIKYGIGGRIYFSKSQVFNSLKPLNYES